jgi:Rieske Fe-S protein
MALVVIDIAPAATGSGGNPGTKKRVAAVKQAAPAAATGNTGNSAGNPGTKKKRVAAVKQAAPVAATGNTGNSAGNEKKSYMALIAFCGVLGCMYLISHSNNKKIK